MAGRPAPKTITLPLNIPARLRVPGLASKALIIQQLGAGEQVLRAQLCINANLQQMQQLAAQAAADEEGAQPAARGAKRRRKDAGAPKRPISAYIAFTSRKRPQVVAEHPGLSSQELTRLLADLWNQASEADKAAAQQEADADKQRYQTEMAAYRAAQAAAAEARLGRGEEEEDGGEGEEALPALKKPRKQKVPKDPSAPPKPRSGYILFTIEARRKLPPDVTFAEATRIVAEEWRVADADTRERFAQLAEQERERYAQLTGRPRPPPKTAKPAPAAAAPGNAAGAPASNVAAGDDAAAGATEPVEAAEAAGEDAA